MDNPLISVIIPVFNRAPLVGETLNSLISQSYKNWECIVVDDGSTDETPVVVEKYVQRDRRFKFFTRPPDRKKGASPCRNLGLDLAQGDFVQFLDSDDLLENTKFEEQIRLLQQFPPLTLVTCKWGSFNSSSSLRVKTKYRSYQNFSPGVNLLYNFGKNDEYFPPIVYLVSRELIKIAGRWDETISNNDDGEYFNRVLMNTDRVIFCENTSAYYRAGNTDRLSLLDNREKIQSNIESWKLIEEQLKEKHKKIAAVYVGNGKRNIYTQIKDSNPEIIEQHNDFFKEVLPFKNRLKMLFRKH